MVSGQISAKDIIKKIRLDRIFDFWHLINNDAGKEVERCVPLADNIEPWTQFKETSFRCYNCHRNITVKITESADPYPERIKTIKTIFSQLHIYGIMVSVKCVCSDCNSDQDDEVKVELKDYLNNKYVISGNWRGYSQWINEVKLILSLISFYEIYSSCQGHGEGQLYKSREAKRYDVNCANVGIDNGAIVRSIYVDDSDDEITRILKQIQADSY